MMDMGGFVTTGSRGVVFGAVPRWRTEWGKCLESGVAWPLQYWGDMSNAAKCLQTTASASAAIAGASKTDGSDLDRCLAALSMFRAMVAGQSLSGALERTGTDCADETVVGHKSKK